MVDASVIVELLARARGVGELENRLFSDPAWNAPQLIDLEVAQVFRRWVRGDRMEAAQGKRALGLMNDLPLHRWPHQVLMPRVWELRENLTAYDAAYVALAEALECVLVTRDQRLASAPGVRVEVMAL